HPRTNRVQGSRDVVVTGPGRAIAASGFRRSPAGRRVMTCWWWFGPFIEEAEPARELPAMAAAGIGGVEVAAVCPLSAAEADRAGGGFLSEPVVAEARRRDRGPARVALRRHPRKRLVLRRAAHRRGDRRRRLPARRRPHRRPIRAGAAHRTVHVPAERLGERALLDLG